MQRETQVKLLRRFFEHRAARTTDMADAAMVNPASAYTDPARTAQEVEVLFRGRPLLAGLSGDLPTTGSYAAVQVGGVPVLLVRGEDGIARAFLNACRHRGARVVEGRGTSGRTFTCPYHAWCYDIGGRLLGQPLAQEAFAEFDTEELGLLRLPVQERFGLIFVRLDGTSPGGGGEPVDVEAELAGLGPELGDYGFENYRFYEERTEPFAMNWKLGVDTFLEAYHIFSLHKATIAPDFVSTPCLHEGFGPHGRVTLFRRSAGDLAESDEDSWDLPANAGLVYRLLPDVVFNLTKTGHLEIWRFTPEGTDPGRCRASATFYTPGEVATDKSRAFWDRNVEFTLGVIFSEDFHAQERIQANLATGLLPVVHYGRNEPGLIHHHRSLDAALSAGPPH